MQTVQCSGTYPAMEGGTWHLWFRQNLQLPQAEGNVRVGAALNIADLEMMPFCRLLLMDNDTNSCTTYLTGGIEPR